MSPRRLLRGALVTASPGITVLLSVALDLALVATSRPVPTEVVLAALLFNGASILQASVGAVIELRRPGHRIGRLLLVTGPLYAAMSALWLTAEDLEAATGGTWTLVLASFGEPLSYVAVALFVVGVPLLFPTGSLPGPGWRMPVAALAVLFTAGLAAEFTRPGMIAEPSTVNPFGISGWPRGLQVLIDLMPAALLGLIGLGLAGQVVRYRHGTGIERLQVRWLAAAVSLVLVGFIGVFVEQLIRTTPGPLATGVIAYAGILAMPIAIGIAVTRYRLYELDRIISRTIGWAIVTGTLVAVFALLVVALQAALAPVTDESTLAVAASTLVAFALFQPLRRRVQQAVDRRFDRARYDGERTATAFAERLRDQIDLGSLQDEMVRVARDTVRPVSTGLWLRNVSIDNHSRIS